MTDRAQLVCKCGASATHLCLVERIGEDGPQSGSEERCEGCTRREDVIDAWLLKEVATWSY